MIEYANSAYRVPGGWTNRIRTAPDRTYQPHLRSWLVPDTAANRRFLKSSFLSAEFSPAAHAAVRTEPAIRDGHAFPARPLGILPHQQEALELAYGLKSYAFFHEMGSGKSRTLLELWKVYWQEGRITEAWVICPNSIINNWHEQISIWAPELRDVIRVYGILSLSQGKLPTELVTRAHDKLAVAVDESQRIKNAQAKRTKVMHEIGKHAAFRTIMTGTPNTKGIEDLYSQYGFLDPQIVGFKSFYSFRNRYCVMGGFENKQIVGYQNIPELLTALAPYTHVVKDPVELPPQAHEDRNIPLSPEQRRLLRELKEMMMTEMEGSVLSVTNALTYYTRGAQILGGFFPLAEGRVAVLDDNPKLDELIEVVEGTDKKVVIFCRFIPEAKLIERKLAKYGIVRLGSDSEDIQGLVNQFQTDPDTRLLVSTYGMGSIGFTLTAGKILVKYSGTFNFEDEIQSEKRIHRIGQTENTMVVRLVADCKLDRHIKAIAQNKQTMADFVSSSLRDPKQLLSLLED